MGLPFIRECVQRSIQRIPIFALLLTMSSGCSHSVVDPGTVSNAPAQRIVQGDATGEHVGQVPVSQVIDLPRRDIPDEYHKVKSGETLSGIAAGHRLPLQKMLDANGLESTTKLQPGQLIYIPSNP